MAQGAAAHAEVPLERFLSAKVEDSCVEECLRSVEQTTMGLVNKRHDILYLY